jgi:Fur family ferric uptake transcriptional regulator
MRGIMEENTFFPKGIKWTKQRKDVYHVLSETTEPMTALEIYQRILEGQDSVSYALSTIYRILTVFEENQLVDKSTFMDDGTVVYELNRGGHTHYAVCLKCHKRIPLQVCPFAHIHVTGHEKTTDAAAAAMQQGFTVTGHKLELYGYCNECQHNI